MLTSSTRLLGQRLQRIALGAPSRIVLLAFAIAATFAFIAAPFAAKASSSAHIDNSLPSMFGAVDVTGPGRVDDMTKHKEVISDADSLATRIARLDGVGAVHPYVESNRTFILDRDGEPVVARPGVPSYLFSWHDGMSLDGQKALTVSQGRAPAGPGEIVLAESVAAEQGASIGDTVSIAGAHSGKPVPATIVGLGGFTPDALLGAPSLYAERGWAAELTYGSQDAVSGLWLDLGDGANPAAVAEASAKVADSPFVSAVTGTQLVQVAGAMVRDQLSFVDPFLMILAGLSVALGIVMVHSSLRLALNDDTPRIVQLRNLGADARQTRSLIWRQSWTIAGIGLVMGAALTYPVYLGLRYSLQQLGVDVMSTRMAIPVEGYALATLAVLLIVCGTSLGPVRTASRLGWLPKPSSHTRRAAIGTWCSAAAPFVLAACGGLLAGVGPSGDIRVLGAFALTTGLLWLATTYGPHVFSLLAGLGGREQVSIERVGLRNLKALRPVMKPAIATSLLCVSALTMLSTMAASIESSIDDQVAGGMKADLVVHSPSKIPFPSGIGDELEHLDSVASLERYGRVKGSLDEKPILFGVVDKEVPQSVGSLTPVSGRIDTLGPGEVVLSEQIAQARGISAGDVIEVRFAQHPIPLNVVGTYEMQDELSFYWMTSRETVAGQGISLDDFAIGVSAAGDVAQARADIEAVTAGYPMVDVYDRSTFGDLAADSVYEALEVARTLFVCLAIVAAVATANTFLIMVLRRSREFTIMRHLGASGATVARLLFFEGASLGVLTGMCGAVVGVAFVRVVFLVAPSKIFREFSWPVADLVAIVAVTIIITAIVSTLAGTKMRSISA